MPYRSFLPLHVSCHPAHLSDLLAVIEACGLPIDEDGADALGSWLDHFGKGSYLGLFAASAVSAVTATG